MNKIKLKQIVVTEGKYDVIKLNSILDALIIPVNGFSIFKDSEKKELLKKLGKQNGIVVITDSDRAGFKIRNYINNICAGCDIKNVYIPNISGKESRKDSPSKEGYLGVEGIDKDIILKCFEQGGVTETAWYEKEYKLTYSDLYELGLSGTDNSSQNRKYLCDKLGIPSALSKKSFLEVLNRITDRKEITEILRQK